MSDPTPQQLATRRRELAMEYRDKMKELGKIKKKKALEIIKLRVNTKTNIEAERAWQATEDGQKEIEIDYYCRGLLELIRSVKTEIEILQAEAYNQY